MFGWSAFVGDLAHFMEIMFILDKVSPLLRLI